MEKSKGKKIVLILIILLFVLLIVAGGAYAYIATDLFKSDEQLFKKYLVSGISEVSKFNSEPYGEAFKRMKNEPTEVAVTTKFDNDDLKQETKLTLKTDIPNRNKALSMRSKIGSQEYIYADFLITDNIYGIHVEGLHDKYIAVENNNLKKIAENLGVEDEIVEMIPDTIADSGFSKEEQDKLVKILTKYFDKVINLLDKDAYKQEKYTIEDFDGETFEGNKYTLEISKEKYVYDFYDILKEFLNDEELLSLLEGKLSEKLIEQLKEFDPEEELDIKDGNLKLSLYSYKGKTIKLDIYADEELLEEIYIINKENSSHMQFKTHKPKTEYNQVASVDVVDLKNVFENNSGEMTFETQTIYNKDDLYALETEYETDKNDDDGMIRYSSFSNYQDIEWYEEREKNSKSIAKITTKVENDVITSKVSFDMNVDTEFPSITYTMKFGNVEVPTLKSDNMILINDYTEEDFSKLGTEIVENAAQTAEEKPNSLIGSYYTFINNNSNTTPDSWNDTDSDYDFSGDLTSDITIDIDYEKDFVNSEIEYAINSLLTDYKIDLEDDPDTNLGDYLTGDKIANEVSLFIENLEIIDGETLKCNYHERTFFTKITIDGSLLTLENVETLYSEDGNLENAE